MRSPLPPTTVSSPWHFSWLRCLSLPERLFTRLCGQQDMATRRCIDSVWVCHHRIAAAATTPTPYRCRLHHQLLRPPFVTLASPFVSPQQPHPLHHQQQHQNNSSSNNSSASSHTSNNNTTNSHHPPHSRAVASRFSPPLQNSHSQALPGRHLAAGRRAAHPLQAVLQKQQQQQQQTYHPRPHSHVPHSRPSLTLSPNSSPHQAGPQYSQPASQPVAYDGI